jgi:predicted homoserine dehydrogenase-like protein
LFSQKEVKKVRLGFIGVGLRGRNHVQNTLLFPEAEIKAICDIDRAAIQQTQKLLREAGRKEAAVYGKNDHDFENLVKRKPSEAQ